MVPKKLYCSSGNILVQNLDIFISIWSYVFMGKTNCMADFMKNQNFLCNKQENAFINDLQATISTK